MHQKIEVKREKVIFLESHRILGAKLGLKANISTAICLLFFKKRQKINISHLNILPIYFQK
jgi:NADH:ubiquinone oxidoreductase subunit K